jgi:hypothetical protein
MKGLIKRVLIPLIPLTLATSLFFANPEQVKAENSDVFQMYTFLGSGISGITFKFPSMRADQSPRFLFNLGIGIETSNFGGLMAEMDISSNPFPYSTYNDYSAINTIEFSTKIAKIFGDDKSIHPYLGLGGNLSYILQGETKNSALGGKFFAGLELSDTRYAFDVEAGSESWWDITNLQTRKKDLDGLYSKIIIKYKF